MFGILVIAFTTYQAQVVPQQNAEVEFDHFQQNQNELTQLRGATLDARTSDTSQYPTIELGITYHTRLLAINSPPPVGVIQTGDPYPINISDQSGNEVSVDTRFIEYKPGYHQMDIGSTWLENSVLYLDEIESSDNRVVVEDQSLVDDETLQITALQNDFRRAGTGTVTLELRTLSENNVGDLSDLEEDDELTVELPTRLESDYWEGQFEESSVVTYNAEDFESDEFDPGVNQIVLTVDDVSVNTIGIGEKPTGDPAKNRQSQSGSDPESDPDDPDEPDDPDDPDEPESEEGPVFESLTVDTGPRDATVGWNVGDQFDSITIDVDGEVRTSTDANSDEEFNKNPGQTPQVTATVENSEGSETCTAQAPNSGNLNKDDFECS